MTIWTAHTVQEWRRWSEPFWLDRFRQIDTRNLWSDSSHDMTYMVGVIMNAEDAHHVKNMLAIATCITHMRIDVYKIDNDVLVALADMIRMNSSVTCLLIDFTEYKIKTTTRNGWRALHHAFYNNRIIQQLDLYDCVKHSYCISNLLPALTYGMALEHLSIVSIASIDSDMMIHRCIKHAAAMPYVTSLVLKCGNGISISSPTLTSMIASNASIAQLTILPKEYGVLYRAYDFLQSNLSLCVINGISCRVYTYFQPFNCIV